MTLNNYIIFLLLLRCVFVYSKNHTTYTLNPKSSQVKLISVPKKAMFLGDLHKNTNKNNSRKKINTHFLHENPKNENGEGDYNYEQENPDQTSLNSEDSYNSSEQSSGDNGSQPDFQEQSQPENSFLDESSSQAVNNQPNTDQAEENKKIVDDIAKEEHMKEMHTNAGQMLDSAKQAKEKADDLLNQFKQGAYTTETNKHSMPKDEAGNIIITNTTTTPAPKHEEEKVDPLKSIRDATLSLFERARHKNLPVSDPGHLSTPEQIYAALNSLEYIIDGYRYSKIDVKDAKNQENVTDSGDASDEGEGNSQSVSPDDSNSSSSDGDEEEEETIMDPDRFLQLKHKNDDDEEGEEGDDANEEDEEDERDESEEGEEHSDENGSGESSGDEAGKNASDKKAATLTPQQAVQDLKEVLAMLTSVLEQVVLDNVGVRNVIVKS
ncbi:hypothetical protein MACJ_000124 [Theileria orientalis]|uniref:Merozoite surface protein 3 n=1 Tax=Theileria orientalis TaxID=68886 RepID=A0A976M3K5_THEOR|nr:hypothetical protein MACJ_000124 [Theileria orientalis]